MITYEELSLDWIVDIIKGNEEDFSKARALSMLDNNIRVYANILGRYYQEYYNFGLDFLNYYNSKDHSMLRMLVHKIKGVSLNLGSKRLYDLVLKLEKKIVRKSVALEEIHLFINYHNRILKYCKEMQEECLKILMN